MSSITIIADGSTRIFAFPFAIFSVAELEVRVDGAVVAEGIDITGEGASDGGHVSFAVPPAANATVTLRRLGKVEVSDQDAPGFLEDKLAAGAGIAIAKAAVPGGEALVISATINPDDYLRKDQNLADLPDAAAARANLGLGSAAILDAGNGADDLVQLDAQGRLPAVDGSQLTDIPFGRVKVSDTDADADFLGVKLAAGDNVTLTAIAGTSGQAVEIAAATDPAVTSQLSVLSDQVSNLIWNQGVLALRSQIGTGWSVLKMVDGWADEFEDEAGVAEAVGMSYDESMGSYATASVPITVTLSEPGTGTWAVPAGVTSLQIEAWGGGGAGGGEFTPVVAGEATYIGPLTANGGGGGTYTGPGGSGGTAAGGDVNITGTDGLPRASATVGGAGGAGAMGGAGGAGGTYSYQHGGPGEAPGGGGGGRGDNNDNAGAGGGGGGYCRINTLAVAPGQELPYTIGAGGQLPPESVNPGAGGGGWIRVTYISPISSLTSQPILAAQSAPGEARLLLLHEAVDAVALNTDLIAEVSRGGGATWSAATLADEGPFDAATRILAGVADLSGQPAGTAMTWRVRTLNAKAQRLHGVWIQWR